MTGGGNNTQPAGNTTTVQKSEPWAGQQPYLTTGFQNAQTLYDTGGPQYYPGQTYAPATDAMNTALSRQVDLATAGNPITGAGQSAALNILSPEFLSSNPGNSLYSSLASGPAMQGAVTSAVQNATPGLLDTFTQGNRLNSPGAAYAVSQGLGNAAAPFVLAGQQAGAQGLSQNYSGAVQNQNQANLLAPQIQNLPYNDIQQLYGAGAQQQQLGQNTINDQISRYNYGQTQPYNLADWYNAAVGGSYGGTTTMESPYFKPPSNTFGDIMSGVTGLGGLGLMSYLALSDRRFKTDIKKIGATDNGVPIYRFRYIAGGPYFLGVMAQELEKVNPAAVHEINGVKLVDYAMVT